MRKAEKSEGEKVGRREDMKIRRRSEDERGRS